jgi:oligoendopeptidase F
LATAIKWDLSPLLEDTSIDFILNRLDSMTKEAEKMQIRYRGKIKDFNIDSLLEFLKEQEKFTLLYEGIINYCQLLYSANSQDQKAKQLNEGVRNALTKVGQELAFTDIELGDLLKNKSEIVYDSKLVEYKHYLERIIRKVPYLLTEKEERVVISKDKNGVNAWSQLQGDWLSTRRFKMIIDGIEKTLSYGEIISLYQSKNRDLRREANRVVYDKLGDDEILWSTAIRSVCSDHLTMCALRNYPSPMTQSLIANDVDEATINALMSVIEKSVSVYQRYLELKAKIMGLPKLGNWDILAPLPNNLEKDYSWAESRRIIVDAYKTFDPEWGAWADEMYSQNHIDGEPRDGKRSGAFCSTWLSGKSAFILQTFNGKMGDVYTQAHELGHAVHAYLGTRHQSPLNNEIGSCIAECGSVFGELLLTDKLLAEAKTRDEKQIVLTTVLDEFGMAAFQVSARVWFEKSMYGLISEGKFLDGLTVANLWTQARDKVYGKKVDWLSEMQWEWTMKQHYYIPNYRFYNYPYVFAQLFVFSLYRLYKEQGKEFVPKMKKLLAAGSSSSPDNLAKDLGFDIGAEEFWKKGILQAEEFINQLEKI